MFADVCINSAASTLPCKDNEIFNTNICGFRYSTITMDHIWRTLISEKTVVLSLPEHPDTSEIRLTFFFCACSFSEALEGLRLNIFFLSGPKIFPWSENSERAAPAQVSEGCCHSRNCRLKKTCLEEGTAAHGCSRTKPVEGSHVVWLKLKWCKHKPMRFVQVCLDPSD